MSTIGSESVVWVKVEPNDGRRRFLVTADIAQTIIDAMPEKYRDNLIGLRRDFSGFAPVFDELTQQVWDKELNAYISGKAAWCEKFGSE